jgi:hypothetical protein
MQRRYPPWQVWTDISVVALVGSLIFCTYLLVQELNK